MENENVKNDSGRPIGTIPVVYAANKSYAPAAAVSIASLAANAKERYRLDIYVLHTELSEDECEMFSRMSRKGVSVRTYSVARQVEGIRHRLYTNFHFSKEMFYRILIPEILSEYDKAIYLDCDTVVLRDIGMLFEIPLDGHTLGGIPDIMHGRSKRYCEEVLGLTPKEYINSGVLLIDCERFRRLGIKERAFSLLLSHRKLRYPDQDILNLALLGDIKLLPRRWNYIWHYLFVRDDPTLNLPKEEQKQYLADAGDVAILHFTSAIKPWTNRTLPQSELFWRYVEDTPFKRAITQRYQKIPMRTYIGYQFLDHAEGGTVITAALYTIDRTELSDIVCAKDGVELPIVSQYSHIVEIGKHYYKRSFFSFFLAEEKQKIGVLFYDRRTGKEMKTTSGMHFPVNKEQNGYFAFREKLMFFRGNTLVIDQSNPEKKRACKQVFSEALSRRDDPVQNKASALRFLYGMLTPFLKQEIWLISDRTDEAGDNGEALFEYLCEHPVKGIKPYFVLDRRSKDFRRLRKIGTVVSPYTRRYQVLFLLASRNISSHMERPIMHPIHSARYLADILAKKKNVFLQHGVTKNDISFAYNRYKDNISLFVTASRAERDSILQNNAYMLDEKKVQLLGFARFDKLINRKEKIIFIAPTWRKSCVQQGFSKEEFKKTEYYAFYTALLHNPELLETARAYGYRLCFYSHPLMASFDDCFDTEDEIFLSKENFSYREMFSRGAILLTDYSSCSFDFAYLEKPVIYAQFDRENFYSSHTYKEGYFSVLRDGFGPVCNNLSDTVKALRQMITEGCRMTEEYQRRVQKFFAFHDKNNAKRITDAILKLN